MIEITEKMKLATWALFDRARSIDPSICVPGTRQFVSHLINVFEMAGFHECDKELKKCKSLVDEAWEIFSEGQWGDAFKRCLPVLDTLGHIAYDDRFSIPDERPFTAPGEVKS
jgi:hypothetical protein